MANSTKHGPAPILGTVKASNVGVPDGI